MMKAPHLTQLEFEKEDFEKAAKIAQRLGFKDNTFYTSSSALWGLYCNRSRSSQKSGCIVKTKELGLIYVQTIEDLNMEDLMEDD